MPLNFKRLYSDNQPHKILVLFLLLWFGFNLLQALLTGLHSDEAYYGLYAKFLEWGYFDHPPMVAAFIKAGSFIDNTLGLRLLTTITNALSIYFLWRIVKKYNAQIGVFIVLFSSVLLFHVYGFITTPDAPLFFFSVLFLYLYQKYLSKDDWQIALLLGLVAAALLYSKYHGILLLLFVLISNLQLFKRPTFYLLIVTALLIFAPHILWQYQNDYPSLQYHLFDRSAEPYELNFTLKYIVDFVLMCGPLTGWLLIYNAYQQKISGDIFLRSLKFTFFGIFIFFLLSTLKGEVQAHWPLIGLIPLLVLASIQISNNQLFINKKWVRMIFGINISLIILCRVLLMVSSDKLNNIKFIASLNGFDIWAKEIEKHSKGYPVIFLDGFQDPSFYNFYTKSIKGFGYDSYRYRKTQFEIFPLEDSIRNRKAFFVQTASHKCTNQDTILTNKGIHYGIWLDSVRMYQKINFVTEDIFHQWQPNETKTIAFKVSNPYKDDISFENGGKAFKCSLRFVIQKDGKIYAVKEVVSDFEHLKIPSKSFKQIAIKISAPSQKGNFKFFISIKTEPFEGSRNSRMMSMTVK